MTVGLLADGLLAALLVATIGLGLRLNRRLATLRQDGAAFTQLIQSFEMLAERAETSLSGLRSASAKAEQVGLHLQNVDRIEQELGYLVARAEDLADRLEHGVSSRRKKLGEVGGIAKAAAGIAEENARAHAGRREIFAALRGAR